MPHVSVRNRLALLVEPSNANVCDTLHPQNASVAISSQKSANLAPHFELGGREGSVAKICHTEADVVVVKLQHGLYYRMTFQKVRMSRHQRSSMKFHSVGNPILPYPPLRLTSISSQPNTS